VDTRGPQPKPRVTPAHTPETTSSSAHQLRNPGEGPATEVPWHDPDPLRTTLDRLLTAVAPTDVPDGHPLPAVLDAALLAWLDKMAERFNDGHSFRSAPFFG
jgi:hypothetical protein